MNHEELLKEVGRRLSANRHNRLAGSRAGTFDGLVELFEREAPDRLTHTEPMSIATMKRTIDAIRLELAASGGDASAILDRVTDIALGVSGCGEAVSAAEVRELIQKMTQP